MLRNADSFLQLSLLSGIPGFPPAHSPAAAVMAEVMVFAAINLTVLVTAMAVTVIALAVRVADSEGTLAAMGGAAGAPTMGP
jgi:hypothetical protein